MNRELSLEEVHKETLNVLKKIDEICEHNDIKYSIMYGTLIGYMRHNGFIPWDDDMDVCMLRPEYDKFVAYCNEHEEELYPFKLSQNIQPMIILLIYKDFVIPDLRWLKRMDYLMRGWDYL